jgi:hypothetical protein
MIQPSTDGHSVKRLNYATEVNQDKTSKTQEGERFATRQAMKEAVFECVEVDYKRTRRTAPTASSARMRLRRNRPLKGVTESIGLDHPSLERYCGVIRLS